MAFREYSWHFNIFGAKGLSRIRGNDVNTKGTTTS